jgi:16S rRNA (guanine966-N2)-methyltransferase
MYIIAGSLKNRKINFPEKMDIRPTLNRVRTIIFDILQFRVSNNPIILDCFAGSGILGIEAYSRWGGEMVFFEINKKFSDILIKNIINLGLMLKSNVLNINALLPRRAKSPASVIFLDPPFTSSHIIGDVIKRLVRSGWIDNSTVLMTHLDKKDNIKIPEYCTMFHERIVGSVKLSFYSCEIIQNEDDNQQL